MPYLFRLVSLFQEHSKAKSSHGEQKHLKKQGDHCESLGSGLFQESDQFG